MFHSLYQFKVQEKGTEREVATAAISTIISVGLIVLRPLQSINCLYAASVLNYKKKHFHKN